MLRENRQTTATINGTPTTYTYDGDGRRVTKTSGGITTTYVYDAMGRLAAEYGGVSSGSGTLLSLSDYFVSVAAL
jgi:YD repeat-containing protein